MTEPEKLLADNFVEAIKQVQQYIVLGWGTSVSALVLTLNPSASVKPQGESAHAGSVIPGTFVAIDPTTARLLLLAICLLAGTLSYYSADAANVIADQLKAASPDVFRVAMTFPSVATSRYIGVRYVASLLPLVLGFLAVFLPNFRQKPINWSLLWVWLVLLVCAYVPLAMELERMPGLLR